MAAPELFLTLWKANGPSSLAEVWRVKPIGPVKRAAGSKSEG